MKVQYPGAADALLADVGNLDRLAPLVRLAAPGLDPRALFAELRDRLVDEVDYVLEADAQTAFAQWGRTTPSERQQALLKIADAIEAHADELIALES